MVHTTFLVELHEEVETQASILFKIFYDSYSNPQVKRLHSFFVLMEKIIANTPCMTARVKAIALIHGNLWEFPRKQR